MSDPTPSRDAAIGADRRELAIVKLLREAGGGEGLTVREIYGTLKESLQDTVTIQAYYKVLDALVKSGRIEVSVGSEDGRRYKASSYLSSEAALGLDEIYEILDTLAPTVALAQLIDARGYFESQRHKTLARAAQLLQEEDPVDLVYRMLIDKFERLEADLRMHLHRPVDEDGELGEHELRDRGLEKRIELRQAELKDLAYASLGLSKRSIAIEPFADIFKGKRPLSLDKDVLLAELKGRVFGAGAIYPAAIGQELDADGRATLTVSGSDGSTHASSMQLMSAAKFMDDSGGYTVSYNNSVVKVRLSERQEKAARKQTYPFYSVPINRNAIDDPNNRGMVLAPFMYRNLQEGQYEHLVKCATDVVQWRADESVFNGTARSIGDGAILPKPRVHFRDGTITPQEREWKHYNKPNEYGDMVREGIALSRKVLQNIAGSDNPPVFAGATKATQKRFFSTVLNWYIVHGSRQRLDGEPLDPSWDQTRAMHIPDNEAMTYLLSTLPSKRGGPYFCTFAVARPFHSLTEYFTTPEEPGFNWIKFFERKRDHELQAYESGMSDDYPYLAQLPDVADDNFVHLCQHADYVYFYVGHTLTADQPCVIPRYEFLATLRDHRDDEARVRAVRRNVGMIVEALDLVQFSLDREHNFLSKKILTKLIPSLIYEAHEKCKAIGKKLEMELRSMVIARLQELRKAKIKASEVEFSPVDAVSYVRKHAAAWRRDAGPKALASEDAAESKEPR